MHLKTIPLSTPKVSGVAYKMDYTLKRTFGCMPLARVLECLQEMQINYQGIDWVIKFRKM
ncbi:MAG: hypothetical protein A2Z14_14875 [Chloroflexi bacterium RBG_16_48_8]|nr:MAG: hypothetical protein A2Z14_14875 [Chloroflexi bacterium RBG_16_48_8]